VVVAGVVVTGDEPPEPPDPLEPADAPEPVATVPCGISSIV
jgi:hypothetical protein